MGFEEEAGFELGELIEEMVDSKPAFQEVRNAITNSKDELLNKVWRHETIPYDWKKELIVKIPIIRRET